MADFTAALMPQIQPIGINPNRMQRVNYAPLINANTDIFGKALQGYQMGQQIQANKQQMEQREYAAAQQREQDRQKSIVLGAAEVKNLPPEQQMSVLEKRAQRLADSGIDNSDTLEAIELLQTDPDAFNQTVDQALNYGYTVGYLTRPKGSEYKESKIPGYAFNPITGRLEVADQSVVDAEAEKRAQAENEKLLKQELDEAKTTFDRSKTLRGEFEKKSTDFKKVRDAYSRVEASVDSPDAAGDLALIFNYMKMLDPGSTVREGEFANAENSGGVGAKVFNVYNKLLNGERLTTEQRGMFQNRSKKLMQAAENQNKRDYNDTLRLGKRYGLSKDDIFGEQSEADTTTKARPENAVEEAPGVADGTTGDGGKYVAQDGYWVPAEQAPPENNVGAAVGMQEGATGMGPDGQQYVVRNGYWVPVPKATTQSQRRTQRSQWRSQR